MVFRVASVPLAGNNERAGKLAVGKTMSIQGVGAWNTTPSIRFSS